VLSNWERIGVKVENECIRGNGRVFGSDWHTIDKQVDTRNEWFAWIRPGRDTGDTEDLIRLCRVRDAHAGTRTIGLVVHRDQDRCGDSTGLIPIKGNGLDAIDAVRIIECVDAQVVERAIKVSRAGLLPIDVDVYKGNPVVITESFRIYRNEEVLAGDKGFIIRADDADPGSALFYGGPENVTSGNEEGQRNGQDGESPAESSCPRLVASRHGNQSME